VAQLVDLNASEADIIALYRAEAEWRAVHSVARRDTLAQAGTSLAAVVCSPEFRLSREL
jgi:hypothetical protein